MPATSRPNAEALLAQGLELYSAGDLDRAVALWQSALKIDPSIAQAREYIEYVQNNRTALEAQFHSSTPSSSGGSEFIDSGDFRGSSEFLGGNEIDLGDRDDDSIPVNIAPLEESLDVGASESDREETLTAAGSYDALSGGVIDLSDDVVEDIDLEDSGGAGGLGEPTLNVPDWGVRNLPSEATLDESVPDLGKGYVFGENVGQWQADFDSDENDQEKHAKKDVDLRGRRTTIPVPRAEQSLDFDSASLRPPTEDPDVPRITKVTTPQSRGRITAVGMEGPQDQADDSLNMLEGGGVVFPGEFNPQDLTPIGLSIPEPSLNSDEEAGRKTTPLPNLPDLSSLPPLQGFAEAERTPSSLAGAPRVTVEAKKEKPAVIDDGPSLFSTEPRLRKDRPGPLEHALKESVKQSSGSYSSNSNSSNSDSSDSLSRDSAFGEAEQTPLQETKRRPSSDVPATRDQIGQVQRLFERGDFESAWNLSQQILQSQGDNGPAQTLARRLEEKLVRNYEARIGNLDQVPVVQMPEHAIIAQKLDHRAGYVLSRIDGMLSYNDLVDICGMPRFQMFRILFQLLEREVIGTRR